MNKDKTVAQGVDLLELADRYDFIAAAAEHNAAAFPDSEPPFDITAAKHRAVASALREKVARDVTLAGSDPIPDNDACSEEQRAIDDFTFMADLEERSVSGNHTFADQLRLAVVALREKAARDAAPADPCWCGVARDGHSAKQQRICDSEALL